MTADAIALSLGGLMGSYARRAAAAARSGRHEDAAYLDERAAEYREKLAAYLADNPQETTMTPTSRTAAPRAKRVDAAAAWKRALKRDDATPEAAEADASPRAPSTPRPDVRAAWRRAMTRPTDANS